jgi:hypothetical protein
MRLKVVYRVLPEAVTEVKEIEPIALVFLLSDGYQVIGEYPDLSRPASPQDYDTGDVVGIILKFERMKL